MRIIDSLARFGVATDRLSFWESLRIGAFGERLTFFFQPIWALAPDESLLTRKLRKVGG